MLNSHKPILESLFIFTLFSLPIPKAVSDELPQQQNQMKEANEKITALASDQQKTAQSISALQTSLDTAHKEISDLKIQHNKLVATNTGTQRTANGHGRGGQ